MSRWAPSSTRGGSALDRVEAPVTLRGYLLCVFAAFGVSFVFVLGGGGMQGMCVAREVANVVSRVFSSVMIPDTSMAFLP